MTWLQNQPVFSTHIRALLLVFLSGAFAGGGARWVRKWEAKALQTFLRLSLREEPKCPVTMQRIFGGSKKARYTCYSQGNG
ncbi:MAG TPA: hypothetical protein DDZ24_03910 [Planctomycetaceae bacterium]|nr:hypothetical protein [Planctomycetaceae bacterium]